jgi:hypothetical protein
VRAGALFVGCQRVTGDEEEDGVDDLDNEFNWNGHDSRSVADSMLYGRGGDPNGAPQPFQLNPNVPLLTNGQMVLLLPNPSITVPLPPPLVIDVSMAQLLVSGVIAGRWHPTGAARAGAFFHGRWGKENPSPPLCGSQLTWYVFGLDDHQPKLSCGHGVLNVLG